MTGWSKSRGGRGQAGFRMPAEWEPHRACWLAWPSHEELWGKDLPVLRREFVEFCRAIDGELLNILVLDSRGEETARRALKGLRASFYAIPFGDIWLRDTGPLFLRDGSGEVASIGFSFNGWGGKYLLEGDTHVAARIAGAAGLRSFSCEQVFEGGAVDVDGQGSCLAARRCLLDPMRNPGSTAADWERLLGESLGIDKVIWLDQVMAGDHTDGHVDTVARFTAPGRVLCTEARSGDDPNGEVYDEVAALLAASADARGRRLEVAKVPSPGRFESDEGEALPASYLNFYVSNISVVVPVFGSAYDKEAVDLIARAFPDRRVCGVPARALIRGGGAFHCITQQEPA